VNKLKVMLCLEMLESRIRANVAQSKQSYLTCIIDEIKREVEKYEEADDSSEPSVAAAASER